MDPYSNIEERLIALKPFLEEKYKVKNIGVFGSFSKDTQSASSDLDILIDLHEPLGVFSANMHSTV